jgi:hypothetical protein
MKKAILALVAVAAVGGSIALADILLPSQAVISGDDAKAVNAKIAEVTGSKGSIFHGSKVLSANASVSCTEFSNGQVSCKINIQK